MGPPRSVGRGPAVDPRDEPCQSIVGRTSHTRRTDQARHRHWPDQRCQVHGAKKRTAVARLENVPAQSCGWYRGHGPICRSDPVLSTAVRVADHGPQPAANPVARCDRSPHRGMDCQPTDGRLRLGANPSRPDPRPGCLLRQHIRWPSSFARDLRSSHICTLTMAERVRRTANRLDTPGMPGPRGGDKRAAPSPHPCVLHGLLQRGAHAPLIGKDAPNGGAVQRHGRIEGGRCSVGFTISTSGSNLR